MHKAACWEIWSRRVELDLYVDLIDGPYRGGNAYHNDQSTPADAVTDTAAFPCDEELP